jgi:hypothetical protein
MSIEQITACEPLLADGTGELPNVFVWGMSATPERNRGSRGSRRSREKALN